MKDLDMLNLKVIKYTKDKKKEWDTFVAKTKNFHFFFYRDYMEYHSNRFTDCSLMIYNKNKLIALLPANKNDDVLYSHQGLTFGGFLIDNKMSSVIMLDIFGNVKNFLKKNGINKIIYKAIPYIYHLNPAEEDRYALFVHDAKLIRRDLTTTIYLTNRLKFQERRKRIIRKALKNNIFIEETNEFRQYWEILENVLRKFHNTKPVHTLHEIKKLASLFPDNIKLFVAKRNDNVLAGTVIFENPKIVHTQYLANSDEGRKLGALDLVIDYLINFYKDKLYFDFGISNENDGRYLNKGLCEYKEGFGGRAVVHDTYELSF